MKSKALSLVAAAALVLMTSSLAKADAINTLYCTGANNTSCFSSNAGLTDYWTVQSDLVLTSGSTFTYTLTISFTNGDGQGNAGYMNHFSGQYWFGNSASVWGLSWIDNPGSWAAPQANKGDNSGSCGGSTKGAFCGAGTGVALGSDPVTFSLSGNYSGTLLENGFWNFQMSATNNADGTGGNAFAISMPVDGTVPEPGSLVLFGSGLLGIASFIRRKVKG